MALGGTVALDNSLGALEIGVTLAALLFGVLCVQAWSYYNEYRRDPWHIKLLVGIIFMGNLLHQIFLSYSLYTLTITHYGEIEWVLSIPWSFLALVGTSGCIAFVAQLFYVHRIYYLSQGMLSLTGFLGATSLAEFVVNMYAVWKAKTITVYTDQYKLKPYLLTYNALGAFLDCVLAGTMIYLLSKNRTKTMFRRTNTMLTRLMMYCLNTGVFTSMAAVLTIITLAIWDKTMIDHPFYFALPRLYGASLLGILNARNDIRNGRNYGTSGMYSANEISIAWAQTHDVYSEDVSSRSTKPTVEPESPCVEECVAMKDLKTELQRPTPS